MSVSKRSPVSEQQDRTRELLSKAFDDFDRDGSGYINSSELGVLCESLDCPLSDQELEEALSMLDREESGKIEKREFLTWWLGQTPPVSQQGSLQSGYGNGEAGRRRLLGVKLSRKQAENDAQLLANRIALLQLEEAKSWKKIQQTRKRAKEILNLRTENEVTKVSRNAQYDTNREATRAAQEARFENKKKAMARRQKAQIDVITKRRDEVLEVRRVRRANELEKQRRREEEMERARQSRELVREQELKLKERRARQEEERRRRNLEEYQKRVAQEERKTIKKESEVARMERLEMELIQRLQNAQMLQKEAYDQLEGALAGR